MILSYPTADGGDRGIDISAACGTSIYATGAGKVVHAGSQLWGYDNFIAIKYSEGYITVYTYNDAMLVNNGQSMETGQRITTVSSSDVTTVWPHFQIHYQAAAIDPLRYLSPQGSKSKC